MIRLSLGLLMLVAVAACSAGGSEPQQAQDMKSDVDAAVREVVPRLASALGAEVAVGNSTGFRECQVSGSWDYAADGAFYGEGLSGATPRKAIVDLLEEQGFTTDEPTEDAVRGRRGSAIVMVEQAVTPAEGPSYRRFSAGAGCTSLSGDAADYARGGHQPDFSELQTFTG